MIREVVRLLCHDFNTIALSILQTKFSSALIHPLFAAEAICQEKPRPIASLNLDLDLVRTSRLANLFYCACFELIG